MIAKVCVFVLVCVHPLLFSLNAGAEQWQPVAGREKFLSLALDLDSLEVSPHDDIIRFRLRADDHDDTIATRVVQASCSEYSLEVERETVYHKSTQRSEPLDWLSNPALRNDPRYTAARLSFWALYSGISVPARSTP